MVKDFDLAIFSGQKLKELRKSRGWTQNDLGKKLKLQATAIGNYERGERPLNQDILFELSDIFDVSINYFFPTTVSKTEIQNIYDQLNDERQIKVYNYAERQLDEQNKIININKYSKNDNADDLIEETMEGYLSAGTGEFLAEDIKEPIMINRSLLPEQHYDMILQVNGDSMEPMFEDHEYVFIRTTEEIRNGQIGVFVIDGESLLKKVYINDDHLRLVSLNKKYDDLIFDSVNDIHLIGTVVM